jgi:hypothetical protein
MKATARVTGVKLRPDFNSRLEKAVNSAARIVFPELNSAFQAAIGSKAWDWLRTTIRSNGQEVGSPRNIVDRGTLRASNSFTISGTLATFSWAVGCATAVHYGANIYPWGNTKAKKVNLPARPWTSAVLGTVRVPGIEPYNYQDTFKRAFIAEFKKL